MANSTAQNPTAQSPTASTPTAQTPPTIPQTPIRRRDRAVGEEAWIEDFLRRAPFGTLALVERGRPFVNTNIFVYDPEERVIYLHTAGKGRTCSHLASEEPVCFSVSEIGRLLPAATAMEFSVEYAGVTVFGRATVIAERDAARRALELLMDKYAPHLRPGEDYRQITDRELELTSVYRVAIDAWSGKKKEVEDDFPGAYRWQDLDAWRQERTA